MTKKSRKFLNLVPLSLLVALVVVSVSVVWAQPPPPPPGFVPMDEVPASEQIPAFNLVAAAYGFVWAVVVGYVVSLASRMKKVEREIGVLEKRGR